MTDALANSGLVIVDKPAGMTSHDVVGRLRRYFHTKKVGHAGTLDPLASGMLPIALGDATKTVPYVMDGRKIYEFTVAWGEERTTDDLEGEAVKTSDRRPGEEEIRALLPRYTGVISQIPPQFSAIKIDGERAYDLAREGETLDIPAREVEVFRLTLLGCTPNLAHFEIECGKGTYVRSMARDLGRDLGCYGHSASLRRSFVAPFAEERMVPLSALTALEKIEDEAERLAALDSHLIDTGEALSSLPHIAVSEDQAHRLRMGNPIILRGRDAPLAEPEAYATARGKLVAIGEIGEGEFRPKRVFNAE